jgi:hypothetical protein
MAKDFSLTPNQDGSSYFLKREGEEGSTEFVSFTAALSYARSCRASSESKVVLFDVFGKEMMKFSVRLPEWTFATAKERGIERPV